MAQGRPAPPGGPLRRARYSIRAQLDVRATTSGCRADLEKSSAEHEKEHVVMMHVELRPLPALEAARAVALSNSYAQCPMSTRRRQPRQP